MDDTQYWKFLDDGRIEFLNTSIKFTDLESVVTSILNGDAAGGGIDTEALSDIIKFKDLLSDIGKYEYMHYNAFAVAYDGIIGDVEYTLNDKTYTLEQDEGILTQQCIEANTYDEFYIYLDGIVEDMSKLTLYYSIDNGESYVEAESDVIKLVAKTDNITIKIMNIDSVDPIVLGGYAVMFGNMDNVNSVTRTKMSVAYQVPSDLAENTILSLPDNKRYLNNNDSLEIFINGRKVVNGMQFEEVSPTEVKFLIPLETDTLIEYREYYGYVDISQDNSKRIDIVEENPMVNGVQVLYNLKGDFREHIEVVGGDPLTLNEKGNIVGGPYTRLNITKEKLTELDWEEEVYFIKQKVRSLSIVSRMHLGTKCLGQYGDFIDNSYVDTEGQQWPSTSALDIPNNVIHIDESIINGKRVEDVVVTNTSNMLEYTENSYNYPALAVAWGDEQSVEIISVQVLKVKTDSEYYRNYYSKSKLVGCLYSPDIDDVPSGYVLKMNFENPVNSRPVHRNLDYINTTGDYPYANKSGWYDVDLISYGTSSGESAADGIIFSINNSAGQYIIFNATTYRNVQYREKVYLHKGEPIIFTLRDIDNGFEMRYTTIQFTYLGEQI